MTADSRRAKEQTWAESPRDHFFDIPQTRQQWRSAMREALLQTGLGLVECRPGSSPVFHFHFHVVQAGGNVSQVNAQQIDGGQHMSEGDKINIHGDNTGIAGSGRARDITTYKRDVDQSSTIDADLKAKLKAARDELDKAVLEDDDKADAAENLDKLTAELAKSDYKPAAVKRLWGRVKEVAPTVASILASAASIAKIVGGG